MNDHMKPAIRDANHENITLYVGTYEIPRKRKNEIARSIQGLIDSVPVRKKYASFSSKFHSHPNDARCLQSADVNINSLQEVFIRVYTVDTYLKCMIYQMLCW